MAYPQIVCALVVLAKRQGPAHTSWDLSQQVLL